MRRCGDVLMGRRCYVLLGRGHDVPVRRRGEAPLRRFGDVPPRRRWVFHLRRTCDVTGTYRQTSLRRRYNVLLSGWNIESKGTINLKLLTRKSMKYLQIFNIYIWKKFFQINHVSNYSGGTSFLQFHTNQTTNRIKLVYFLNCP